MAATTITERALALMGPLLGVDAESDALLEALVRGMGQPVEQLSLAVYGDDTREPLDVLVDPTRSEAWSLDHAMQWNGGARPPRLSGESDEAYLARSMVASARPLGIARGSTAALAELVASYLTPTQVVHIAEDTDDGILTALVSVDPEVPTPVDAIEAAANDPAAVAIGWRVVVQDGDEATIATWTRTLDATTEQLDDLDIGDVT